MSQDFFLFTCLLVTNLEESTVILIHQLSDFGVSGHKFSETLKMLNGNLFKQRQRTPSVQRS